MSTQQRPVRVRVIGDLFHGRIPDGAVYVGRAAPGLSASPYANPHRVGSCRRCGVTHDRTDAVAAYARDLTTDLRRPWEKPRPAQRLTPARIRRGFRKLRRQVACPAGVPKPSRPGPSRPAGTPNQRPASRHDVHTVTSTNTRKSNHGKNTKSSNPRPRRTG